MLRIRELRKRQGLTLKALEEKTGIKLRLLSKYELETIDPPSSKLLRIAKGLGVEVGELFSSRSTKPAPRPKKGTPNGQQKDPRHGD
jgi:transcriptional regulator with XRE-family HTH domain